MSNTANRHSAPSTARSMAMALAVVALTTSLATAASCHIDLPTDGSSVRDDVAIQFDVQHAGPTAVTVDYSVDGGATWNLATAADLPGNENPTMVVSPALDQTFVWSTADDQVGLGQNTIIRISSRCTVYDFVAFAVVDVETFWPGLEFTVSPGTPLGRSGKVRFDIVGTCDIAIQLDLDVEFSLDGGATWVAATAAGSSRHDRPVAASPTGETTRFTWNSTRDLPRGVLPTVVLVRFTVSSNGYAVGSDTQVTAP